MSNLLFVYGTLQRQGGVHHLLVGQATFLESARLQGRLYELSGYPGAVLSDNRQDCIRGELYRMHEPDLLLARLDAYEEIGPGFPTPHEYLRVLTRVTDTRQKLRKAWTYIYNHCTIHLPRITKGRWHLEDR